MGTFKHTGVADATALTQYLTANQAVNGTSNYLSTVAGTNTITASGTFTPSAYAAGQTFSFIAAASNTAATTINISSLGAKNIYKRSSGGLIALVAKDLIIAQTYSVTYDGTQFVLNQQRPYSQGADIVCAATINLDTATGDYVHVTGSTGPVTAITLGQGEQRTVVFDSTPSITAGASLILPTGLTAAAAGDVAVFRGEGSSVVRCVQYTRASGAALVVTATTQSVTDSSANVATTAFVRLFRQAAQIQTTVSSAVATGTTLIPADDTIPQITEGDQYLTQAITPISATSLLEIDVELVLSSNSTGRMTVALFQDATANALAAVGSYIGSTGTEFTIPLKFLVASGTTSSTTFRVRAGMQNAGTTTVNGVGGARTYGGVLQSRISIKEYLP